MEKQCPICSESIFQPLLKTHILLEKSFLREMREARTEQLYTSKLQAKYLEEYKRKHQHYIEQVRELRSKVKAVRSSSTGTVVSETEEEI